MQDQNPTKEVELKFLIRQSPAHVGVRQGEQNLLNWINTDIFFNKLNGKLGALAAEVVQGRADAADAVS